MEPEGHEHTDVCDTGCCDKLEAEGEIAVARLVMDGGDLAHAANHVGGAVGTDPSLPEAYEVLAELVARAGGPEAALELFPPSVSYVGSHACRAALLSAVGRHSEAVFLLGAVIGTAPADPWASAAWLAALTTPEAAADLDPGAVSTALAHVTQAITDPAEEPARSAVAPYYALVREVVGQHPDHKPLVCLASSLARRMDDLDTAIAWARSAADFRTEPGGDALGAAMLGSALRRAGRAEEAIALWRETVRQQPSQTFLAVDLAETLAGLGRPAEGVAVLEPVVRAVPDHEKAVPALSALRYQVSGDSRHLLALHDHLRQYPDHRYAGYLLARWCDDQPWLSRNDFATEATTNAVHELVKRQGFGVTGNIRMQLSGLETPSSVLTARLAAPGFTATYTAIPQPDPRVPYREGEVRLWRFEDTDSQPAVPPPSEKASALARDLATHHWQTPPALYDRAFGLAGLPLADLLGLLVHPPSPRESPWPGESALKAPDFWVRAVQTLACTAIAHHQAEEPWAGSARRSVLLDLLDGPEDWVCEAAGMALVTVGWMFPETRAEVGERVLERLTATIRAGGTRPVSILDSMLRLSMACGWLSPETMAMLQKSHARRMGEEESGEDVAADGSGAVAGDAKPKRKLFGRR
jgi:tetratricopeptide (TPR) repeat protein